MVMYIISIIKSTKQQTVNTVVPIGGLIIKSQNLRGMDSDDDD